MNSQKISQTTIIVVLSLFGLYFLVTAFVTALIPFSQAYDESPLMVCSWAMSNGYPLYNPAAFYSIPFYIAEHPPIIYLLQSALIHFFGISHTALRFLVMLSAIGSAFLISGTAVKLGAKKSSAAIGALIFICLEPVSSWIRYSNPQIPALFFELSAVYVILGGFTTVRVMSFAALVLLSLYTNQTLPAVALGCLLGFFLEGKRAPASLTALIAALAWGLVLLVLTLATHGGYIMHTIGTSSKFFGWDILKGNLADTASQPFFLTAAAIALVAAAKSHRPKLILPLVSVPLVWGIFSLVSPNSTVRVFVPASAGAAVALSLSYKPFTDEERSPAELKWMTAIVIFITLTLSLYFKVNAIKGWHEKMRDIGKYRAQNPASELIKSVTRKGALVFSQLPDLPIYVERVPAFSDPRLTAEMLRCGLWNPAPFEEALENRGILALLTRRMFERHMAGGVFTPPIVRIIKRNYKLLPFRAEGYFLYIPKKPE